MIIPQLPSFGLMTVSRKGEKRKLKKTGAKYVETVKLVVKFIAGNIESSLFDLPYKKLISQDQA